MQESMTPIEPTESLINKILLIIMIITVIMIMRMIITIMKISRFLIKFYTSIAKHYKPIDFLSHNRLRYNCWILKNKSKINIK